MLERIGDFTSEYLSAFRIPHVGILDILEIFILAFLIYEAMIMIKNTRAWTFLKGIAVVLIFLAVAVMLNMTTIIWIAKNLLYIVAMAVIVALQPEIRRVIETIGQKNFFTTLNPFDVKENEGAFSDKTLNEIVNASFEMGKVRTGALIVVEQNTPLGEYERTGIAVDGIVSSQLLINIFEHNTPLHDGAVIIRKDRIVSATCYLPLTDTRTLSKDLGTRHRAGVGISELTDSMTIIVSEETGKVSVAYKGQLYRNLNADGLREQLAIIQNKPQTEKKARFWQKGRSKKNKDEKENNEQS
ncbi:MAG: diadenylate cyclase CdaA [Lachnospiraceae bacterium]|nr:diadenylate cyclase CdaA [Lachnospiraceae bacterium]